MPPGGGPTPPGVPATPEQPPVFTGTVQVRVFSSTIVTGETGTPVNTAPKQMDAIEENLKEIEGVGPVSYNSLKATLDISYTGPYERIAEVEKAVLRTRVKATLTSPAIVSFHPVGVTDEAKLTEALKGVCGVQHITRDTRGAFQLYMSADSVDLEKIRNAAKGVGMPGTVSTHEEIELDCVIDEKADVEGLKQQLLSTPYVLRVRLEDETLKVLVIKGRCSQTIVKKLAVRAGLKFKKGRLGRS